MGRQGCGGGNEDEADDKRSEREEGIEQHSRGVEGVNENLCFRALLSIVCQSGIAKRERMVEDCLVWKGPGKFSFHCSKSLNEKIN